MTDVYVGLGSNIRPEHHLRQAVHRLSRHFGRLRCSAVYQSPPYGFAGDDFLNLVAMFASGLPPDAIESVLSAVEDAGGRPQDRERAGSRTLDLDLLLYGTRVDAGQRLPRADVLQYPFVLAPLYELAPDLVHPVTGITLGDAWRSMRDRRPPLRRRGDIESLR
jgi:2-amino-4-hydroxy-6-hydroxymethyldihydropteridine diphosphokinase